MNEAFVYLWYDAPNRMYYLGKHKGSPDDTYTHSSTIWESFTKDNIPEGVTREILAEGTDEEMCILEHELLVEAKNGDDWDRYYNKSMGDPRYVDQSGENNPFYKHGICAGQNDWFNWPEENKERRRAYQRTPEYMANSRKPERVAKRKKYDKKRNQTPERKAWKKKYDAERHAKKMTERQGEGTLVAHISNADDFTHDIPEIPINTQIN